MRAEDPGRSMMHTRKELLPAWVYIGSSTERKKLSLSELFGVPVFAQHVAQTCRQSASERNAVLQHRKLRRWKPVSFCAMVRLCKPSERAPLSVSDSLVLFVPLMDW
jgi:hypothetical protein